VQAVQRSWRPIAPHPMQVSTVTRSGRSMRPRYSTVKSSF
jgi:hypothetical protein